MKKIIYRLLVCANIILIALMLVTGYAGCINPAHHPYLSLIGFAFPAFLLANVFFLVTWVIIRPLYVIVPVAGLLLAYSPVRTYTPVNISQDPPEGALKVLSYNVLYFNSDNLPSDVPNPILKYLIASEADIICLQEYYELKGQDSLLNEMDRIYPHKALMASDGYVSAGGAWLAVYSKYPITEKKRIEMTTRGNTLGVFTVDINGKPVHVINAHLETVGLSKEEKTQFSEIVHGQTDRDGMKSRTRNLMEKLAVSARIRGPQADRINEYIEQHEGEQIIFCGDINDHPLSYVHRTISQNLTDCYRETGFMPGYSFEYHSMYVRIDHIMCSDHFTPYSCVVDKSIRESDHYPIYCYLKAQDSAD